jgi:hypothetical protein
MTVTTPDPRCEETTRHADSCKRRAVRMVAGQRLCTQHAEIAERNMATVPGCGRCADLLAAYILTGSARFRHQLRQHLAGHEPAPSIHGDLS